MAVEPDSEHLVGFTLVPVGTGVVRNPGRHRHRLGHVGLDRDTDVAFEIGDPGEHLEAGLAARIALLDLGVGFGRLGVGVVLALAERRRHPVERRQEAEVLEPLGLERSCGEPPCLGGDPHPQVGLRDQVGVEQVLAEIGSQIIDDALAEAVTRQLCGLLGGGVTQSDHRRRRSAREPARTWPSGGRRSAAAW